MAEQLKIGIIGAGNIGNVHIETFKKVDDVDIVAITDVYQPLAEQRAEEHGIANVHETADALINDADIDAIVIGVPNKWHAPIATQALQAGKHVLLEKPMALNVDDARQIVRAQRDSGKTLMIGHQMRWQWVAQEIKRHVQNGNLGDIYHAKTGWFRRKGIPGWGTWFTQKEVSGGGPLIDIGVHMLDLALYLMGNPKPISVYGSTYAEFGPKKKGIGGWGTPNWDGKYDVEDLATALIKMDNGSTLSLEVSWAVHMDTSNQPFIHLNGSEGGASVNGNKGKILTENFDRAIDIDLEQPAGVEEDRVAMSRHFVACIRDGKEPLTSVMSGFTNNLILDAIYRSSESGKEITLDWDI